MFNVKLNGSSFALKNKTTILSLIDKKDAKKYYAAKVNNRLRELTYELCFDADVELLTLKDYDSMKIYEASLRYLISMAFHNLYPDYNIRISYNISRTLLVSILKPNGIFINNSMIEEITNEINRLVELDLPFEKLMKSKEEMKKYYKKNNELDKEAILKYRPEKMCHLYQCGDYLNYMYCYMVPSTGYINSFKLFTYDNQIVVQYPRYEFGGEIPPFVDAPIFAKVLKRAHKWAKLCNSEVISKMNDHIQEDSYVDFINMNETLHNDMLHELGDQISKDIDNIRLICIAGPSSSGKTTFSNRLKIELMSRGINPLRISLDMYYKGKDQCPVDEDGKPDFEHIESLNLELFNEQMIALINGEEVALPTFNFETGKTEFKNKVKIEEHTPIIIEGIHALNDRLSYAIPKHQKYKIYIAPQFQINIDNQNPISFTDIRLLRRIVRDKKYRGTSAEATLAMWDSVRRGEFKWIYPYQEECNYIYNSALTYEINVMKKYAYPALQEIPSSSPYYIAANRLLKVLKHVKDMDDQYVPCNSLLREFIGGSCFKDV